MFDVDLQRFQPQLTTIATGLAFPEGPIWFPDGSVVLVEIAAGRLTRVQPDGSTETIADCGGGPNGAAVGPDGAIYVANNGGSFDFIDLGGALFPGPPPESWAGGSIQRIDPASGEVATLYTQSEDRPLLGPNDLVFDATGNLWFSDHGLRRHQRADRTGLHYARPDGTLCEEKIAPVDSPNGIGLSADGTTLYAAETHTGRVWRWPLSGPGEPQQPGIPDVGGGGLLLAGLPGLVMLDSLAVDSEGWVCVASLGEHCGIIAISPDGSAIEHYATDDLITTNICFGGNDLRTAFVTCSSSGRLVSFDWPRRGLPLAF